MVKDSEQMASKFSYVALLLRYSYLIMIFFFQQLQLLKQKFYFQYCYYFKLNFIKIYLLFPFATQYLYFINYVQLKLPKMLDFDYIFFQKQYVLITLKYYYFLTIFISVNFQIISAFLYFFVIVRLIFIILAGFFYIFFYKCQAIRFILGIQNFFNTGMNLQLFQILLQILILLQYLIKEKILIINYYLDYDQ